MAVTTTDQIFSLVSQLGRDFPDLSFIEGTVFSWQPDQKAVVYNPSGDLKDLLHEVGHALLHHDGYSRDIQLLSLERAAWDYATKTLSPAYNIPISLEHIEASLDTYREWLHVRSSCPICGINGLQTEATIYSCPSCHHKWTVNEAKICRLIRKSLPKTSS